MTEAIKLTTHTGSKAVLLTSELEGALPTIEQAFDQVDQEFNQDRRGYLEQLEESQFEIKTDNGPTINCSLLMNKGSQAEDLMIVFAPFADCEPKSSAKTMYRYIDGDESVGKSEAKPNSWSQTTKSAVTRDLLEALDHGACQY